MSPFFRRRPANTPFSSLNGERLTAPGLIPRLEGDVSCCCHQESCALRFLSAVSVGDQELGGGDTCRLPMEGNGGGRDTC